MESEKFALESKLNVFLIMFELISSIPNLSGTAYEVKISAYKRRFSPFMQQLKSTISLHHF